LTLLTLRFADEILPLSDESESGAKVSSAELSMAKRLIEQMSGKFKPEHFKDTYHADLERRVQEKIRNKETHALDVAPPSPSERPKAEVINLMDALKASLARNQARPRSHATHRARKRA
jgi:DNA end-binding protein Ku